MTPIIVIWLLFVAFITFDETIQLSNLGLTKKQAITARVTKYLLGGRHIYICNAGSRINMGHLASGKQWEKYSFSSF